MSETMKFEYFHPSQGSDGKRLSTANIIWAERNLGSAYYRVSRFAMRAGKFPSNHPCANSEMGKASGLDAFRARGYWASCFPEGDGITLKWWGEPGLGDSDKTAEEVMRDIRECFGWEIVRGAQ
jgi:hypothetical protein